MQKAFYRKWRPKVFDDVCGQEHITSILRYEAEHRAFSHAYLFCGSRGTGKTTCAKILAKVVNCEHPVNGNPCLECPSCRAVEVGSTTDVIEMDAASNNGVDNIRDIREEVIYLPSELKYRVYIIDEVHMLSPSAFNALLKTLEEPPEHVIFILATTELQKLPATIVSRCQRFDFRRISTDAMVRRLSYIAKEEGLALDPDAARMLAKLSQGGMRDAISLLELTAGTDRNITPAVVERTVGLTGRDVLLETVRAISEKDYDKLFSTVDTVINSAKDLLVFWQDLLSLYRDLLVLKTTKDAGAYLDLTQDEKESLTALAAAFRKETLLSHCRMLEDAFLAMQKANAVKRVVAESTLLQLADESLSPTPEALLSRIAKLEDALATGASPAPQRQPSPVEKAAPVQEKKQSPQSAKEVPGVTAQPKRILRPVKAWAEILDRVERTDPPTAGFLKKAEGYFVGDGQANLLVRVSSTLAQQLLQADDAKDLVLSALAGTIGADRAALRLSVEVVRPQDPPSPLDEIIESMEESSSAYKGE